MWSVDGNLDMVIGTRGGRYQPQLLSHFILKILKNENLENAMTSPRWNIDEFGKKSLSEINIEPGLDKKITDELVNKGHKLINLQNYKIAMDLYQQLLKLKIIGKLHMI